MGSQWPALAVTLRFDACLRTRKHYLALQKGESTIWSPDGTLSSELKSPLRPLRMGATMCSLPDSWTD